MQQDFQVLQSNGLDATRNSVLRNTYRLLGLSMLPTAVGAVLGVNSSFAFLAASPIMGTILLMAGVYGLMFAIERNKYSATGVYLLLGLTFLMGFMLGPILQVSLHLRNGGQLVGLAAAGTGLTFLGMSAFGSNVNRDFNRIGNFLSAGAIVLLVCMVAQIFLRLPMFQLVIAGGFMIFSSLMISYQINQIVRGGETNYISATLTLYISIYNIFVSLLQILMAFSGNDRD